MKIPRKAKLFKLESSLYTNRLVITLIKLIDFLTDRLLHVYIYIYICHGRKSNLVEFEILPAECPIGVSTKKNLVESPTGVSTGRKSNL